MGREIYIYNENLGNVVINHQSKDGYFLMIEHGFCYTESCYECRWRSHCSADLRIGDYWGNKFEKDRTGVSMILALTQTGEDVLKKLEQNGKTIHLQNMDDYLKCQQIKNAQKPLFYDKVMNALQDETFSLEDIVSIYIKPFEKKRKLYRKVYGIYAWINGKRKR